MEIPGVGFVVDRSGRKKAVLMRRNEPERLSPL
jgi:hypothetical protein